MASSSWSDAEDKALEAGLAQYPASMEKNERWKLISEHVGGSRSKKDCVARFKAIRRALLESKQQQQQEEMGKEQTADAGIAAAVPAAVPAAAPVPVSAPALAPAAEAAPAQAPALAPAPNTVSITASTKSATRPSSLPRTSGNTKNSNNRNKNNNNINNNNNNKDATKKKAAAASQSQQSADGSGSGKGKDGLLIPGQAVNRANHRRASGGGGERGGGTGNNDKSGKAATAAHLDAGAAEFTPPSADDAETTKGNNNNAKAKGSRGGGRGNKKNAVVASREQTDKADAAGTTTGDNAKGPSSQQGKRGKKQQQTAAASSGEAKEDNGNDDGKSQKKKKRNKKKKTKKGGAKFAWRNQVPTGAVDPISLDPLVDLPYPPFALVATEPYDVIVKWPVSDEEEHRMDLLRGAGAEGGTSRRDVEEAERELGVIREQWGEAVAASASAFSGGQKGAPTTDVDDDADGKEGCANPAPIADSNEEANKVAAASETAGGSSSRRRYYHLFDGRVLAYYLVSQLQFIDPLNRRDLTRPELANLDAYLRRHQLGRAGVTEAYDARGLTVSAAGVSGQTVEGRAEMLQQEAGTLLGSLFGGDTSAAAAARRQQLADRARATAPLPRFQNEFERHYVESERRHQGGGGSRGGSRSGSSGRQQGGGANQAQDDGIYAAEEGGMLIIDDDVNPGLRGGIGAASESARRHRERTGRGGGGGSGSGGGPASGGPDTLSSASRIAGQYGHASRVRADNFPSLQAMTAGEDAQQPPSKPKAAQAAAAAKPSKSLLKISNIVKKTSPAEAARQKRATEEARKKAALANLSFHVPGTQSTSVGGGDGIGAATSALLGAAGAGGGAAATSEPTQGLLDRNRAMASALGVQPATMRNTFNSGWARGEAQIEIDEFGNELNAAQYTDALIVEAKERMAELLKLERRWKTFLADDKASSHPLRAMPRDLRKFVHEYSDFWNLHTESFDPEGRRYIHCTKMRATSVPHPLLSEAARKWRGPGTGAPALPAVRPKAEGGAQLQTRRTTAAREFTTTEQRVPLKLEPRSVPPGYVAASMQVPAGAMFDMSDAVPKAQNEEEDGGDRQPAERFSSLLEERESARSKLSLAPRTKPLELPAYQPPEKKSYDVAKAREKREREKKEQLDKQRKKEEKTKNILASAFASSSDDDSGNESSDWGEDQEAVFDGSDSEW